jgi:hypothetical protein
MSANVTIRVRNEAVECDERISKTTPDAPAALPTKTGLPKIAKETARVVVGTIATAPYFFDESSTTCLLNGPSITFDVSASII